MLQSSKDLRFHNTPNHNDKFMNKVIEQRVQFDATTAKELFEIFLTAKKHAAIHGGAKTKISKHEGEEFSLLNGNLTGRNLMVVPNKMIVQSWRGNVWKKDDLDSILTLVFSNIKDGAQIEMVHAFTPSQFTELWNEVYWQPIRKYLRKRSDLENLE
jgi:activator of HSP90 ATPase